MKMRRQYIKISTEDMYIILYFVFFSVRFLTNINKNVSGILWGMYGVFLFIHTYKKLKDHKKFLIILLWIDIIGFINGYLNGNNTFSSAVYVLSAQSLGLEVYVNRKKISLTRCILLFIYTYAFIKILINPYIDSYDGRGISLLIGKNSVSILMILACSIDLIYREKCRKGNNYLLYIVGMLISVLTNSSGGILGFIVFALGVYICKNHGNRLSWIKILSLIIAIAIIVFGGNLSRIIDFLKDDNSRFAIWRLYITLAINSIKNILLGGNISNNITLLKYLNMHNNFLNWHYCFGLIPTIAFFSVVIYEFWYFFRNKEWYKFVICTAIFVRSMTDGTDYCFMTLWTYFIIYILDSTKKSNINKKEIDNIYSRKLCVDE